MGKQKPKHLTKRQRAARRDAGPQVVVFDDPPVSFAGTIEQYIDRMDQRLRADAQPDDPAEWNEHDAELIEALREEYQAGRLAFHKSADGLVYGLEVVPLSLQAPTVGPLRGITWTPEISAAA